MGTTRSDDVRGRSRARRKGSAAGYAILLSGAVAGLALVGVGSSSGEPTGDRVVMGESGGPFLPAGDTGEKVQGVINQYCVACHNQNLLTADLALDTVDAANPASHPETWEKVITKLRAGAMPPAGIPRPDSDVYDVVTAWLEGELDAHWEQDPEPGRVNAVHRLNRTEYGNAIRDLLALEVDVAGELPGDETGGHGFDNVADALTISTAHMERYLSIARRVSRLAVGLPPSAPANEIYEADDLKAQDARMSDDLPLGSRGGLAVRHNFPADGEYVISLRLQDNYADYVRGMGFPQTLEVRIDGELVERFTVGGKAWEYLPAPASYEGAGGGPGWRGSPEWEEYMQIEAQRGLQVRVPVRAGPAVVGVSFVRDRWEHESLLPQPPHPRWGQIDAVSAEPSGYAGVSEVHIDGPHGVEGPPKDTPSRQAIFTCEPEDESEEVACAEEILSDLARRAYRRPVSDDEVGELLRFFQMGREEGGSFDHGIQFGLERILADPDFLLRIYRDPEPRQATEPSGSQSDDVVRLAGGLEVPTDRAYRLSDLELASRLSFFLWSSIPDTTLLDLAEEGRLSDEEVLREQVERMLRDPRATETLVHDFAAQWLNLRGVEDLVTDERIYVDYDHNLRDAIQRETEFFIASTIREDRSVLTLLDADYTYLNERLARHYRIPGVTGSHFRRVQLPDREERGGLLAHASILAATSYPDRTTPVLRGEWVLENIIGLPVPAPPPGVDTSLDEDEVGAAEDVPLRERLAAHRDNPACSSCHNMIDPMGFALEGFDVLGARRTVDEWGHPVDDLGVWVSGQEVEGFSGLRTMLVDQKGDLFVRALTERLMEYALGRAVGSYDQPMIRRIAREAAQEDHRWSSIIVGIVESPQFLMRSRGDEAARSSR